MSTGRHTKPLFELLRDESSEGRRPVVRGAPPAYPQPEVKPARPVPAPVREATPDAPRPVSTPDEGAAPAGALVVRGGVVSMSVYGAYLGLAAVLAVTVIVWVVAYNSGRRNAEHELGSRLQNGLPAGVTDPRSLIESARDPLADAGPAVEPPPKAGTETKAPVPPSPGPSGVPGKILTAAGTAAQDPRTARLNYQVLAHSIPEEEARAMVGFLTKNGLDVIGVPLPPKVDRTGAGDNNPTLYKVVSTMGLTSDQYKNNDPARSRQQAEVLRLGQLWKATKVGRSALDSTYWESLKP